MRTITHAGDCVPMQAKSDEAARGQAAGHDTRSRRRGLALAVMGALLAFVLAFAAAPASAATFSNSGPIAIPDSGQANPYPSAITVSGLDGTITDVNVTLTGVSHIFPDDIDVLLVGPSGQNVVLLADTGLYAAANNVNLTFDDAAPTLVPNSIVTGTYQPTNAGAFNGTPPAPAGPYGSALSVFNGTAPNGAWNLFVYDDFAGWSGAIAGGWSLDITTPNGLNVTAPNGGETYAMGSLQTATWTAPAQTTGLYGVWAVSVPNEVHTWIGAQNAVAGQTSYSLAWWVGNEPAGDYRLRVSYGSDLYTWLATDYSDAPFTIAAAPTVSGFAPTSGPVGTVVTLTGTNFSGATVVAFHGTAATTFTVDTATQITATVPTGATSGTIAVTTPGGSAASAASFTVIPAPTVTPKLTLKLSGLKRGVLKLGKSVMARGNVTPTRLAGSKVTLTAQLKKGTKWVKAKTLSALITSTGAYRCKYKPAKKGAYRMKCSLATTATHAGATTKWLAFKVK